MAAPKPVSLTRVNADAYVGPDPQPLVVVGSVPGGGGGGTPEWGAIEGTLSDQTDLKNALEAKANVADLGTAAGADTTDFATAAQGALADSAVQPDDLDGLVPDTRTINGKPLSGDVTLSPSDVGALPDDYEPPSELPISVPGDITATGTPSSSTYLRGDGSWNTPPNTTYSAIGQSDIENPASTTSGLVTGQRAAQAVAANLSTRGIGSGANQIAGFWRGTQAEYDLLTPDSATLYVIVEE